MSLRFRLRLNFKNFVKIDHEFDFQFFLLRLTLLSFDLQNICLEIKFEVQINVLRLRLNLILKLCLQG